MSLRKEIIKKDFSRMNDMQFKAVTTVKGPVLVLAGAGSGKTTVLVNRIANIIKFGNAYNSAFIPNYSEQDIIAGQRYLKGETDFLPRGIFSVEPANPWEILAITFTNKAANELKERIAARLGDEAMDVWAGTFHSVCGKILRRNAELLGYSSHFTIYDTDDQQRLMKEIMKQNSVDDKLLPHRAVLSAISSAKDSMISPKEMKAQAGSDYRRKMIAELYEIYQRRLKSNDAMDFDDMIVNTVRLLKENREVLDYYCNRFKYIMVDEYQDTNHAQYLLVSLLASGRNNICVVGDDDQSIYRFRGATIENILSFEDEYPNCTTIRLEQNYRSTGTILNAANAVIGNNRGRKGKTLWTNNGSGELIRIHTAADEREEALYVADLILENVRAGGKFSDHAVLYRMNAQSNTFENVFARSGIPHVIIGGLRFFERKEIKDVLAYLSVINNPNDDIRLRRVINEPKRGIGDTTVNNALQIAGELGIGLYEVFHRADEFATISRSAAKLKAFCNMMDSLIELADELSMHELFEEMLDRTGYRAALEAEGQEAVDRLENVKEFSSNILNYEFENDQPTLSGFLEEIALVTDIDSMNEDTDKTVLMTIHSAKGLEFKYVYLVGMEDGVFPGSRTIYAGPEEIEEERRLAYVAITRAKERLFITNTYSRMLFGMTGRNMPSRFLKEIPPELCECSASLSAGASLYNSGQSSGGYSYGRAASNSAYPKAGGLSQRNSLNRAAVSDSSALLKGAAASKGEASAYSSGQRVRHKTFGEGMIISVHPMGNDVMLEIAFDNVGTKKLMAGFAKLSVI